jgi:heme/copper-type cytochrome/quinol oxidase subunit 4
MRERKPGLWLGVALTAVGLVTLIKEAVPWWMEANFLWGTAVAVIGIAFFISYTQQRRRGYLLLGWTALGIAAAIFLNSLHRTGEELAGPAFLLFLSFGFLSLHSRKPHGWWPALLGGGLFVAAILSATTSLRLLEGVATGALFFFGLALVFLYLYLIRTPENRLHWAKYAAVICLLISGLILTTDQLPALRDYFWPILLLGTGLLLILRDLLRKPTPTRQETPPSETEATRPDTW